MGAWIETEITPDAVVAISVAPYVGAWIETLQIFENCVNIKSHLTWVRGLKHHRAKYAVRLVESHLTWVRGLKL